MLHSQPDYEVKNKENLSLDQNEHNQDTREIESIPTNKLRVS